MANFNDLLPAAPAGAINVRWQADESANISAYYSKSEAQTPWTQDVDAAGFRLNNSRRVGIKAANATAGADVFYYGSAGVQRWQAGLMPDDQGFSIARCDDSGTAIERVIEGNRSTGLVTIRSLAVPGTIQSPYSATHGHSFNLAWDGSTFRYVADGSGFVIRHDGFLRIYGANSGLAGAVATLNPPVMLVQPTSINFNGVGINVGPSTAGAAYPFQYIGQGGNIQWVVGMTNDATNNDFSFARRNGGAAVDTPLLLSRATGSAKFAQNIESPIDTNNRLGHSFNLTWDGTNFRYGAANYGGVFRFTTDGSFRLAIASSGAAGAVATTVDVLVMRAGSSAMRTDSMTLYPQTAGAGAYQYFSTSTFATRWGLSMSADTANNFEIARYTGVSAFQDIPFSIANASGNVTLAKYLILTTRTNAVDDAAAAAAGVPIGGAYHNAGALRIRLA